MLMMATAGLKPCATSSESSETTNDGCAFCPAPADSFDAERGVPVCYACAEDDDS
jgi:hypothetical protein